MELQKVEEALHKDNRLSRSVAFNDLQRLVRSGFSPDSLFITSGIEPQEFTKRCQYFEELIIKRAKTPKKRYP